MFSNNFYFQRRIFYESTDAIIRFFTPYDLGERNRLLREMCDKYSQIPLLICSKPDGVRVLKYLNYNPTDLPLVRFLRFSIRHLNWPIFSYVHNHIRDEEFAYSHRIICREFYKLFEKPIKQHHDVLQKMIMMYHTWVQEFFIVLCLLGDLDIAKDYYNDNPIYITEWIIYGPKSLCHWLHHPDYFQWYTYEVARILALPSVTFALPDMTFAI
jgi:hypothetical protein